MRPTDIPRAVIYARYSTDLQSPQSIGDQIRCCRTRAEAEGWRVSDIYTDEAISGASLNRPGIQALLRAIDRQEMEVIVVEAFDRLSRDMADMATIYKRAEFHGVRLFSLADGFASQMTVGLRSMMDSEFLRALKQKTHRGLEGVVLEGRHTARPPYGYRAERSDPEGKRGVLVVDEAQAAVVRRIYQDHADGKSPNAIAKALNAEGILSPTGKPWRDTTIRGHATRMSGILRNPIYHGILVWNRTEYRKHYETGRRNARVRDPEEQVTCEVPHLRIVDEDLWKAVQARLTAIGDTTRAKKLSQSTTAFWQHRRPKHLLSGLVLCGACGGLMGNAGRDYLGCINARKSGTCSNRKTIRRSHVEAIALASMQDRLMAPEHVAAFISDVQAEVRKRLAESRQARRREEQALATLRKQQKNIIEMISNGRAPQSLLAKLESLDAEIAGLEERLAREEAPPQLDLNPNLAEIYREGVHELGNRISSPEASAAREGLRALIERIVVTYDPASGHEVLLEGDIAAMVDLARGLNSKENPASAEPEAGLVLRRSVKVVAGAGFEPATFRL